MVVGQEVVRFLFQRVASGALVIVFASALTFFFVNLAPGGPSSIMRFDVTAEQREALIKRMGLDKPVTQRYVEWATGAVRGDLGTSLLTDEPVTQRIGERLPNTLMLAGAAFVLSVMLGVPIGLIQALRRGSPLDHVLSFFSAIGLAAFVDYGGAWYDGSVRRTGFDVGVGLRFGLTRVTETQSNRVDLACRPRNEQGKLECRLVLERGFAFSTSGRLDR